MNEMTWLQKFVGWLKAVTGRSRRDQSSTQPPGSSNHTRDAKPDAKPPDTIYPLW